MGFLPSSIMHPYMYFNHTKFNCFLIIWTRPLFLTHLELSLWLFSFSCELSQCVDLHPTLGELPQLVVVG